MAWILLQALQDTNVPTSSTIEVGWEESDGTVIVTHRRRVNRLSNPDIVAFKAEAEAKLDKHWEGVAFFNAAKPIVENFMNS